MVPAIEPQTLQEKEVAGAAGDWLQSVRKKASTSTGTDSTTAAPSTPAPPSAPAPKPAPSTPAPSTPAPGVLAQEPGPQQSEWDLESPEQCCSWIVKCFSAKRQKEIEPLARFYISQLRAEKGPLSDNFYKHVIGPRLLASSKGRDSWVQSTKYNRSKRFVAAPEEVYKK